MINNINITIIVQNMSLSAGSGNNLLYNRFIYFCCKIQKKSFKGKIFYIYFHGRSTSKK